jgi:hypothetical protein
MHDSADKGYALKMADVADSARLDLLRLRRGEA